MPVEDAMRAPLRIHSGQGDYDVSWCGLAQIADLAQSSDVLTLIDDRVAHLHPTLSGKFESMRTYALTATEEEKTLQGVERLCRFLQGRGASKRSQLIVIGGGITQDIGTFAAHLYYRGIPFTYVPTTLLAMADSCIGAKCAVNLGKFKNQLGFFQSPSRVLICPEFLETLAPDDVRSGFGEIVKLAITSGEDDYARLEARLGAQGFRLSGVQDVIFRSLETKRRLIEQDEYERDLRKTLNYGHTFGHALESITDHEVPHGLAVAWGLDVANFVSMRAGILTHSAFERIHGLLAKNFAFEIGRPYTAGDLVAAMRSDKKAAGNTVTLILATGIGSLQLVPRRLDADLEALVAEYMRVYDIFSPVGVLGG